MNWNDLKKLVALIIFLALPGLALAEDLNKAIVDRVMEQNSLNPDRCVIDVEFSSLKTRIVDPSDLSVEPVADRPARGNYPVQVRIEQNGTPVERGQVRLNIRLFDTVLVAVNKISRHEELQATDFVAKYEEITSLREQPVRSVEALERTRAKTNVRLGEILTSDVLQPVPDIEVGGEVTIIYADTWGKITTPGKVLQDGLIGETVRVKNQSSGKIITAQVVDSRSVSVGP